MELLEAISTFISSKNLHLDDAFQAMQMVNFSLLHDVGRPVNTLYQLRCDTLVLVIALQLGLSSTGFIASNIILIQRAYSPKLQVNMEIKVNSSRDV